MSLRLRLLLGFLAVVALSIFSLLLIVRRETSAEVVRFMGGFGIDQAQLADELETFYASQGSWEGVEQLLPASQGMGRMNRGGAPLRLRLGDANGQPVVDTVNAVPKPFTATEKRAAIELSDPTHGRIGYLLVEMPNQGPAMMNRSSQLLLERLESASVKAGLVAAGLAILLAVLLSGQIVRPLAQLNRASEAIAQGNLAERVTVTGKDELARLGTTFNDMADTLERSEKVRRDMMADIAHELRTPLAVQRAHIEALQDGVRPLTVENLQPVLAQTEMLAGLVEDLRTLALADAGKLPLDFAAVQVSGLLEAARERFTAPAQAAGVELALNLPDRSANIRADRRRIDQVLNNLIANALRHTPTGKTVHLAAAYENGMARISIRDEGPGIPAGEEERIFERYFRGRPDPNLPEGNLGLGLTIARRIALLHGGNLTARNHGQGGAEFTLLLPLAEQTS